MKNIKQKIIAIILLIVVVGGLIWLTSLIKSNNKTDSTDNTGITLFTKKNPGTKDVKNQGNIGNQNNEFTGNDTTKPVSIVENIINTITGKNDNATTDDKNVPIGNNGIGQAIKNFFLGSDGLPASAPETGTVAPVVVSDPFALVETETVDNIAPESLDRECQPKVYTSKLTLKNELELNIKNGVRKKETLTESEQQLLAWKPTSDEIDEDNMKRVLDRYWDMWSYPTSYLKDCQWSDYEKQGIFEKSKREVRDLFASISSIVGSQYTAQEAKNYSLTTTNTISRYKDTISDCRLIRGLFENPNNPEVPGYPYNWKNLPADEIHSSIRLDIAERVKNGDLKKLIKNDSLRAELSQKDENLNQSALSVTVRDFSRWNKKIINPGNGGWPGYSSIDGEEQQFHVRGQDSNSIKKSLDTDTRIKNRGVDPNDPTKGLYEVCNYDEGCGTDNSLIVSNEYPGIYTVRLPQSIWDILRQDRSKNLFCTFNKMMANWAYQEWEITRNQDFAVGRSHVLNMNSYGMMCDNNLIEDDRVSVVYHEKLQVSISGRGVYTSPLRKIYELKPYYDNSADVREGGLRSDGSTFKNNPKGTSIVLPTYMHISAENMDAIEPLGVITVLTTENRDNWYSLTPLKARFDFFKDDE